MFLLTFVGMICGIQNFSIVTDGYSDKLSAFPGDSLDLYINSYYDAKNYPLHLYDMSGKPVARFSMDLFAQSTTIANPYENGFGYRRTKRVKVPNLPSGIYLWDNQIPLIIKARQAKMIVVYPSNTANAYANSGGKSLYGFNSSDLIGAEKVSFQRPIPLQRHSESFFRWLPKQNFTDIGFISDQDLDDFNSIKRADLILIVGHSEYWTLKARQNFDRFVSSGKNALILSGNTMWWQVRYERSNTQLVCYRDVKKDPIKSEKLKTINWFAPALEYPIINSIGVDFRNAGYGLKKDRGWDGYKILVKSPLLEGTTLSRGDVVICPTDETDGTNLLSIENGFASIDYQSLGFEQIEVVGYDLVSRGSKEGVATWIVFKPTRSSGIVINTASTDWCSYRGIGSNSDIEKITLNMINKLLKNEKVFSTQEGLEHVN
jgi:hypothetical protein